MRRGDRHRRMVAALERDWHTRQQLAARFGISPANVTNWLVALRRTHALERDGDRTGCRYRIRRAG